MDKNMAHVDVPSIEGVVSPRD